MIDRLVAILSLDSQSAVIWLVLRYFWLLKMEHIIYISPQSLFSQFFSFMFLAWSS